MKNIYFSLFNSIIPAALLSTLLCQTPAQAQSERGASVPANFNPSALSADFQLNEGQWQPEVLYKAGLAGSVVSFMEGGLSMGISREVYEEEEEHEGIHEEENEPHEYLVWNMSFVGMSANCRVEATGETKSVVNYLLGNNPEKWVIGAKDYKVLQYNDLYNNIDLRYYSKEKQLKYDLILHPGADANNIQFEFEGIEGLSIAQDGKLLINTAWGSYHEAAPYSYQNIDGVEHPVAVNFKTYNDYTFGFEIVGNYDKDLPLIIDPWTMIFGTYFKSTSQTTNTYAFDAAIDANKNIYVCGHADNLLPTTPGAYDQTFAGGDWYPLDAYVAKLSADGSTMEYLTFIGGVNTDVARSIEVNSSGEAIFAGHTRSPFYPTTAGAYNTSYNGHFPGPPLFSTTAGDIFVSRLNAAGTAILASTFLGGKNDDKCFALDVDAAGNCYVTGSTSSNDMPVTLGAVQTLYSASSEAYVAKLSANATTLLYCTYLGGSSSDAGNTLVVNASGEVFVGGETRSSNFPTTTGAFDETLNAARDGWVAKLNTNGTALHYCSFLGGNDGGFGGDYVYDVFVNASDELYVTGATNSTDFPTVNPFQSTWQGGGGIQGNNDAFISKFNAAGSALLYSTYLGGSGDDQGYCIVVNAAGVAYVSGKTASVDFPIINSAQAYGGDLWDIFMVTLDAQGGALETSCGGATYLGGNHNDYQGGRLIIDESGATDTVIICGTSHSTNFPTTVGAYETAKLNTGAGSGDQPVVSKLVPCIPVLSTHFLSFTGDWTADKKVLLRWEVAQQQNVATFELARSTDSKNFKTIAEVYANGKSVFTFTDVSVPPGRHYYRVKLNYNNGSFDFSDLVVLSKESGISILDLYPNPNTGQFTIDINTEEETRIRIKVSDILGKAMETREHKLNPGHSSIKFNAHELAPGMYTLLLTDIHGKPIDHQKFIIK